VATRLQVLHRVTSVVIGLAVPLAVYLVNGTVEPWAFVLAAVVGFLFWYAAPFILP
jgi:hypothetical protein